MSEILESPKRKLKPTRPLAARSTGLVFAGGVQEARNAPARHEPKQERFKWEREQLHDYVLSAVNTGRRTDEAWRLQFRDVNNRPGRTYRRDVS